MFGSIGVPELLIIFAIALLIFGPKKLPEVGKSIGRALREFRKTSDEIKGKIEEEIQADEFRDLQKDIDNIGKEDSSRFSSGGTKSDKTKDPYSEDQEPDISTKTKANQKQETKNHEEGKKKP